MKALTSRAKVRMGDLCTVTPKRAVLAALAGIMLCLALATPAMASSSQNYSIVIPVVGAGWTTTTKSVAAHEEFGVRHRYSGGKKVTFLVCDSSHNPLGGPIAINPGGANAPLVTLWTNPYGATVPVSVKLDTGFTLVKVLAEGTWSWNY